MDTEDSNSLRRQIKYPKLEVSLLRRTQDHLIFYISELWFFPRVYYNSFRGYFAGVVYNLDSKLQFIGNFNGRRRTDATV